MRERTGAPMPSIDQYNSQDDFMQSVGAMFNDEQIIERYKVPQVSAEMPESLISRLLGKIKSGPFKKKQPDLPVGAKTSQSVASGKRRDPLF
jgi:hypothetical protein